MDIPRPNHERTRLAYVQRTVEQVRAELLDYANAGGNLPDDWTDEQKRLWIASILWGVIARAGELAAAVAGLVDIVQERIERLDDLEQRVMKLEKRRR